MSSAVSVMDHRQILGAERLFLLGVDDSRLEELLGDQGRHERRQDDDGHQLGVLGPVDQMVREAEQAEMEPKVSPVAISSVV